MGEPSAEDQDGLGASEAHEPFTLKCLCNPETVLTEAIRCHVLRSKNGSNRTKQLQDARRALAARAADAAATLLPLGADPRMSQ